VELSEYKKIKRVYRITAIVSALILVLAMASIVLTQRQVEALSANLTALNEEVKQKDVEQKRVKQQMQALEQQLSIESQSADALRTQLDKQRESATNGEELFDKVCYLTFDDGPSPLTTEILDILSKNHVKATFFVVYTAYGDDNNLYQQIVDEGHAIGNHCYTHTYPKSTGFYDDFMKLQDFLDNEIGLRPEIVRIPGGTESRWSPDSVSAQNVKRLADEGYVYFDWTTLAFDSRREKLPAETLVENVVQHAKDRPTEVVLMHDREDNRTTPEALQGVIDYFRSQGYVFMPLDVNSTAPQFYHAYS
jgi:peptidoglycan/xylan/chitin deacetylase (PgdA/CDA1 family)